MKVQLNIPDELEPAFRKAFGPDIDRTVVERLAVDGYRTGKLSQYHVQVLLGLDNRWKTEQWLGEHGLHQGYTAEDLQADRQTLDGLLGPSGH